VAVTDPDPERVRVAVEVAVPRADRVRVYVFEDVAVTEKALERVAVVVGLRVAAARDLVGVLTAEDVGDLEAEDGTLLDPDGTTARERVLVPVGLRVAVVVGLSMARLAVEVPVTTRERVVVTVAVGLPVRTAWLGDTVRV